MALIRSRLPQRLGTTGFIWRKRAVSESAPAEVVMQFSLWFINNSA